MYRVFFPPGQLIEMFKNIEELKEELRRTTGMSNNSIDKLLAIPIPDNRAEVRSASVPPCRLYKCKHA